MQNWDYLFRLSRRDVLFGALSGTVCICMGPAHAARADEAAALLNEIRHASGLGSMAVDARLEGAARYQARRMAQYRRVSHAIGRGNGFVARLRKAGIHGPAAENLCAGQKDVRSAFKAWMNSPGHRRNILDPEFAHYGLARAVAEDKTDYVYWAMVLGR